MQAQLDGDAVCDVCIAKSVLSPTYAARRASAPCKRALTPRPQAARDRNIPILTEAWVHACAARGHPLAPDEAAPFLLPPFAGLHICVTGLDVGAHHA